MDPSDLRELRRQLENLSGRLSAIEARLGMGIAHPTPPQPPPVLHSPMVEQPPPEPVTKPVPPHPRELWPTPPRPLIPVKPVIPPKPAIDLEYLLGAKALPWAAALLLLIGIGTLVSLGFSRGWITPWMLWWGGVSLSAGFIGVGQWKREEKEQFGQILTGIGSCGLYLTFGAGHVAQHLYSGETLVLQFVTLSLVNLGYALWRGSMAFLIIGVIGGFAGALMPLQEGKAELNVGLHMLILSASVVIAARHKWWSILSVLAASSFLLLAPMIDLRGHLELKIGALYVNGLVILLGLSRRDASTGWDEHEVFTPLMAMVPAFWAFAILNTSIGALHVGVWSVAVIGVGLTAKLRLLRSRLIQSGVVLATCLAPFAFGLSVASAIEGSLAVLACLVALARKEAVFQSLALLLNALAIGAYLTQVQTPSGLVWTNEIGILAILGTATLTNLITRWRLAGRNDEVLVGASLILLPLFVRAWERALTQPGVGAHLWFALGTGLVIPSCVMTAALRRLRSFGLEVVNWFVVGGFSFLYFAFALEGPKLGLEAIFAAGCIVATLGLAVSSLVLEQSDEARSAFQMAVTWLAGAFAVRILFRVLSEGSLSLGQMPALIIALASIGFFAFLIGRAPSRIGLGYASFGYLAIAIVTYLSWISSIGANLRPLETTLNLVLELWTIGLIGWVSRFALRPSVSFAIGGWILWLLLPRLAVMYLSRAPIGIPVTAAFGLGTMALIPAALLLSRREGWHDLRVSAFVWLLFAGGCYADTASNVPFQVWAELPMNLALGGLLYWMAAEFARATSDRSTIWTLACIAGWALSSRFGLVALTSQAIGMEVNPAVSITWTIYALTLLTIGFMRHIGPVRFFGLFVFAATTTQVIAVDLDNVEPALRVVVSMALGFAMLGVGYWYIRRSRSGLTPSVSSGPE